MLKLNYANCFSDRVGSHGLDAAIFGPGAEAHEAITSATARLNRTKGTGWERWRGLPLDPTRTEYATAVKGAVASVAGKFDTCVVLGIGGSALGNIAIHTALQPSTYNLLAGKDPSQPRVFTQNDWPVHLAKSGTQHLPRLFVVDNVDPLLLSSVLDFCARQPGGLKKTLFNVISKSGETAETAAQFMIIRDMLKHAVGSGYAANIVAITDPTRGTMRQICDAEKFTTLPVPDGVGGRFSALSPVGLFSAALCGIDIDQLLLGAADMNACCERPDVLRNPAALLAFLLIELAERKGKPNHVMMPYANSLYLLADWYRQLWAESLGKEKDLKGNEVFAGFTPIKALGTTDQHSQVQLYREGPNDKVIGFVEVETFDRDVQIPRGLGVDSIKYLEGSSIATLLQAEKVATEFALVESQRPNFTITFPRIDAYHVGQFIWLWQMATAYAGLLLNVDAYDQPAVELGKQATFGLMGRSGYEHFKTDVEKGLSPTQHVIND